MRVMWGAALAVTLGTGAGAQSTEENVDPAVIDYDLVHALAEEVAALHEEVESLKAELRRMTVESAETDTMLFKKINRLEGRMLLPR